MKKIFKYLMLPLVAVGLFSCAKQEIVFDHEKQAFETREGMILIEGIMPQASTADEEIYIVGPFNGFVGPFYDEDGQFIEYNNSAYLMERSSTIPQKWGIYLDPTTFVGGKTLADGFTFISATQGEERDSRGKTVMHTLNIGAGEWANVYVDKWAKYFQKDPGPQPLPTHDGLRIYIVDETGWDAIALYQWGDVNDLGGSWPGAQVAGTLKYEGVNYKYFEYGDEAFGLTQNLIFNNNNGGVQLGDYKVTFEAGVPDLFLLVNAEGVTPLDGPTPEEKLPEHDGKVWVSIIDQTGWDAIALYQWGDVNDLGGGWPGAQVVATFDYQGATWKYFEYDAAEVAGLAQNLIFNNNNNGTQLGDYKLTFEEGVADYLFVVTADGVTPYSGDEPEPGPEPEPDPDPKNDPVTIYIDNQVGYEALAIYMYGDAELCGKWPGLAPSKTEDIAGVTYSVFVVEDAMERAENIILNNGAGSQLADFAVTFVKPAYYFTATAEGLVEIDDPHPAGEPSVLYIAQDCGWESVALYAWGDQECFGKWPGKTPDSSVSLSGVKYSVWNLGAEFYGLGENLILNNNGAGSQANGPYVTLGTDLVYSISADQTWTLVENPSIRVYVINETGWAELHLYSWGTKDYFGGWPGAVPAGKQTVGGVEYDYFDVPAEAFAAAGDCNFIFNNNAGTQYENDPGLKGNKATHDYFFKLTATGASVIE